MNPPIVIPDGFTREQLVACADREIRMRERVYPERVALGKMSAKQSHEEMAAMRAIRAVLQQLPATPPRQGALFEGTRR